MFPLGRGQRELIVGDAGMGKQTFVRGAIIAQKRANRIYSPDGQGRRRLWSVYSCLGSRGTKAVGLSKILKRKGSMWYNYRSHETLFPLILSSGINNTSEESITVSLSDLR